MGGLAEGATKLFKNTTIIGQLWKRRDKKKKKDKKKRRARAVESAASLLLAQNNTAILNAQTAHLAEIQRRRLAGTAPSNAAADLLV